MKGIDGKTREECNDISKALIKFAESMSGSEIKSKFLPDIKGSLKDKILSLSLLLPKTIELINAILIGNSVYCDP